MTSDLMGFRGTRWFALLTTFQMLLGLEALSVSGPGFLPTNHHTSAASQLKSFYGFLLSTGQSPDSLARHSVFYALALSCFSPAPLFRIQRAPQLLAAGH